MSEKHHVENKDIAGSQFRHADMSGAVFEDVDLSGAKFFNVNLRGTSFGCMNTGEDRPREPGTGKEVGPRRLPESQVGNFSLSVGLVSCFLSS